VFFTKNLIRHLNWDLIEFINKEHISVCFSGNCIEKIVGTPSPDLKKPISGPFARLDLTKNKLSTSQIKKIKYATDMELRYKTLLKLAKSGQALCAIHEDIYTLFALFSSLMITKFCLPGDEDLVTFAFWTMSCFTLMRQPRSGYARNFYKEVLSKQQKAVSVDL
jgi:hypothetical protein